MTIERTSSGVLTSARSIIFTAIQPADSIGDDSDVRDFIACPAMRLMSGEVSRRVLRSGTHLRILKTSNSISVRYLRSAEGAATAGFRVDNISARYFSSPDAEAAIVSGAISRLAMNSGSVLTDQPLIIGGWRIYAYSVEQREQVPVQHGLLEAHNR